MALFVGIDIGTTHVKIIAANELSAVVCEEKASYSMYQPQDGYGEQDADEIFNALLNVFKKISTKINTREIAAVCFSAAYHSILAVDKDGNPLTPLITWADTRSNDYAKHLKKSGQARSIYLKTGVPVHPMSPLCKIAWIRDQQPDVFEKAFKFISMKEYAWHKLFGKYQVDHSIASATGLFNSKELVWCDEALAFCGINPDHLSEPVPVLHTETGLKENYRQQWNLHEDVRFVAGAGDGATANLGCGALSPRIAALTIGTSGAIRVVTEKPIQDDKGSIFSYILAGNLFINGGAINNGGIALQWFLQTFLQKQSASENDYEWMFKEIADVKKGADGLLFLPYIFGERAPVWDADAKGAFIGIRSSHTLKHFMRAVIEGICLSLLQVLDNIEGKSPVDAIYATGGFTQSELWLQLLADILNKKIYVLNTADASAMGAIYMAMHAKGVIQDWDDVKRFAVVQKEFIPAGDREKIYSDHIRIFSNLYDKLKEDFDRL